VKHVTNIHNTTNVWSHDSLHREGVPYANRAVAQRYNAPVRNNLQSPQSHYTPSPAASQPGQRFGNRTVPPNNPTQNRSAFSHVENGQAARAHTDHGFASLGPQRSSGGGGGSQRSAPASRGNSGGGGRRR